MDGDGLGPVRVCHHHRPAGDAVGGQDRHLGLVDDRDSEVGAERTVVGDGERAPCDVVGVQLSAACPLGQVADAPGHAAQRDLLGPVDHRHDQTLVGEVHCDAQIDLRVHQQRVVDHRRVEQREVAQGLHGSPGDEGEVRQRESLLRLEALTPGVAHTFHALEIDFVGDERVRRRGLRTDHVLSGPAAHVREGHQLVAGGAERRHGDGRRRRRSHHRRCRWADHRRRRRRRCRWRRGRGRGRGRLWCGGWCRLGRRGRLLGRPAGLDDSQRVIPSDATAVPGPGDLGLADPVFRQEPADHRGKEHGAAAAVGLRHGRRGRRRGGGCRRRRSRRRCCRGWCRWRRLGGRRRRRGGRAARCARAGIVADDRKTHADLHRLALGDEDLGEDACRGRGHFGIDLVRRYLEERFVALDGVAHALHPAGDRSLGHGLAELRHHHVSQGAVPFRSTPAWSRRSSRRGTGAAG